MTTNTESVALKKLGDIPNIDGFSFTGILHDGTEVSCEVQCIGAYPHTYYVGFVGGEPCFDKLKGWRK